MRWVIDLWGGISTYPIFLCWLLTEGTASDEVEEESKVLSEEIAEYDILNGLLLLMMHKKWKEKCIECHNCLRKKSGNGKNMSQLFPVVLLDSCLIGPHPLTPSFSDSSLKNPLNISIISCHL